MALGSARLSIDSTRSILALNAGSSSLKFGLYLVGADTCEMLVSGAADVIADECVAFAAKDSDGSVLANDRLAIGSPYAAINRITELVTAQHLRPIAAVGHRIVHGGRHCRHHAVIDAAVMQNMMDARVFAPLHVPPALLLLEYAQRQFPDVPQVACFDTTFHTTLPDVARTLPIPKELRALGIERYGFHGLSCESIVRQFGRDIPERLVIAHLGHGASVTAVAKGVSVDTSMGLTPSGGVIMSSRCGDIDPGVLALLVREKGYNAEDLEALIDHRSGMVGISGLSGDMRKLRSASGSNPDAALAIAMFCYSVRKQIAAMTAVLGGVDTLAFAGGIGENDAITRGSICEGLEWLGLHAGKPGVRVVPADENAQIAIHTGQLTR